MITRKGRRVTHVKVSVKGDVLEWTLIGQSQRGTRYRLESFETKRGKTGQKDAQKALDSQAA